MVIDHQVTLGIWGASRNLCNTSPELHEMAAAVTVDGVTLLWFEELGPMAVIAVGGTTENNPKVLQLWSDFTRTPEHNALYGSSPSASLNAIRDGFVAWLANKELNRKP